MVAYSFKKRFVTPIKVGLGQIEHIPGTEYVPKRQTIRAIGKRRHARPGETLQLYSGMRTKQCFKIGEARCKAVRRIRIDVREHSMPTSIEGQHIGGGRLRDFAQADGFAHAEDMLAFWKENHGLGVFDGILIEWEPL